MGARRRSQVFVKPTHSACGSPFHEGDEKAEQRTQGQSCRASAEFSSIANCARVSFDDANRKLPTDDK